MRIIVSIGVLTDNRREAESEIYRELENITNNPLIKDFAIVTQPTQEEEIKTSDERIVYCPDCKKDVALVSEAQHSVGMLHAVCPTCNFCPDCDEGAV